MTDETVAGAHRTWSVSVDRHEFLSPRTFDEVVAGVRAGLGTPDFAELRAKLDALADWTEFSDAIDSAAGTSGLIVFLELDLGAVLDRDPRASGYKLVRIIAGNPITMAAMTRSTPAAGAFAPVTVLVYEASDGVHCRYDTLASAVGPELTVDAAVTANKLDAAVLNLLSSAL